MIRFLSALAGIWLAGAAFAAPLAVVTEDFPPYSYVGADGKLTGYSVELTREALARAGLRYTMAMYPWARAYQMAQSQPDVLIFSIVRTPEREAQFQWVAQIASRNVYVYKLARRGDISVKSLDDLRRYRIAANRGDIVEEQLHQLGLPADLSNQDQTSLKKLLAGRVDLMVASAASMKGICDAAGISMALLERTIAMPGVTDYYVAASRGTPAATVQRLRAAFGKIRASDLADRLAGKYGVGVR